MKSPDSRLLLNVRNRYSAHCSNLLDVLFNIYTLIFIPASVATKRLLSLPEYQAAGRISVYLSMPSGEISTSVKPTKVKISSSVSLGVSVARAGTRARNKTKRDRLFMGHRVISTSSSNWQSGRARSPLPRCHNPIPLEKCRPA